MNKLSTSTYHEKKKKKKPCDNKATVFNTKTEENIYDNPKEDFSHVTNVMREIPSFLLAEYIKLKKQSMQCATEETTEIEVNCL